DRLGPKRRLPETGGRLRVSTSAEGQGRRDPASAREGGRAPASPTARRLNRGWTPSWFFPVAIVLVTLWRGPRWVLMWVLAAWLFSGVKWLTWRQASVPEATVGRRLGYLLLWPGLDAPAFLDPHP